MTALARAGRLLLAALVSLLLAAPLPAIAVELRLALQATGTARWELAAMQALGLDRAHGLDLSLREVADSRAGQIALLAGQADVILSDFVWVSLQRDAGEPIALVPHSLAVGGLVVAASSGIATLADLAGKTIAVSGSPVDKSFVLLAARYRAETGQDLAQSSELRFGAPPLVNQLLLEGRAQAALNLWNWSARARAAGMVELVSVPQLLADAGLARTPPLLGWVFRDDPDKAEAITAFLDASFATKSALATDDAIWDGLRPLMDVGGDDALFTALRDAYRAGIVLSYGPEDVAAAEAYFALVAAQGGLEAVGGAERLAPGTFWPGYRR